MLQKGVPAGKIVSSDGPKEDERLHEQLLKEWLATTVEPEEESARRRAVLERLNQLVKLWVCHTMITEFRMQEAAAKQISGRIFATGSYRYNVHTSGSDIDIVLIAPARVTRDHFFTSLAARLKNEPWITELHCIRESRVPIIAMVCDGIDIDLSFGAIRQDCVPEVITDDLLLGLDEASVLSCNAVRVAHNIMTLVPDSGVFRQTLRFVKAWGKQRGIYSNTFGFPSGIGWAILVAFVSQCYPNKNAAGLITRFFRTYSTWFKPNPREIGSENRAIYLTGSMRTKTPLGKCWDPRENKSDAMALFPVLTPALPYSNACYNVTATNLKQLCSEFVRGKMLTDEYLSMQPTVAQDTFGPYGIWSKLLEPAKFFGEFSHYMHIQVSCSDADLYQAYVDGVESRIRILWAGNASSRGHTLEDIPQLRLRLNPKRFEDPVEVARRMEVLKKAASLSSAPQSARASTRESGTMMSARPSTTITASVPSTAHYFIGMTVDTAISSARIDLAPAIRVFHQVVAQLKQYSEGITALPTIKVCECKDVPTFVLDAAGYHPPESTATEAAPEGEVAAQQSSSQADGNQEEVQESVGMKRPRDEAKPPSAPSQSAPPPPQQQQMAHPIPSHGKPRAVMEEMNLEEALGLDF